MKILMLADLHYRKEWFRWIEQQEVDAVLIAGDLLDGFSDGGLLPQMLWIPAPAKSEKPPLCNSASTAGKLEVGSKK